jgi:hypothetical protein
MNRPYRPWEYARQAAMVRAGGSVLRNREPAPATRPGGPEPGGPEPGGAGPKIVLAYGLSATPRVYRAATTHASAVTASEPITPRTTGT